MAAQIQQPSSEEEMQQVSEINVTPFIDVILVLLIIFMIAAPLATVDIPVDLPASTAPRQARPEKPIFVTLQADHSVAIGDTPLARTELADTLSRATQGDRTKRVFVRADKVVPYGDVMTLMNDLRNAGFLKIALVGLQSRSSQ